MRTALCYGRLAGYQPQMTRLDAYNEKTVRTQQTIVILPPTFPPHSNNYLRPSCSCSLVVVTQIRGPTHAIIQQVGALDSWRGLINKSSTLRIEPMTSTLAVVKVNHKTTGAIGTCTNLRVINRKATIPRSLGRLLVTLPELQGAFGCSHEHANGLYTPTVLTFPDRLV